jgi:hypothetical protein
MLQGSPMYYIIFSLLFIASIALFFIVRRKQQSPG